MDQKYNSNILIHYKLTDQYKNSQENYENNFT